MVFVLFSARPLLFHRLLQFANLRLHASVPVYGRPARWYVAGLARSCEFLLGCVARGCLGHPLGLGFGVGLRIGPALGGSFQPIPALVRPIEAGLNLRLGLTGIVRCALAVRCGASQPGRASLKSAQCVSIVWLVGVRVAYRAQLSRALQASAPALGQALALGKLSGCSVLSLPAQASLLMQRLGGMLMGRATLGCPCLRCGRYLGSSRILAIAQCLRFMLCVHVFHRLEDGTRLLLGSASPLRSSQGDPSCRLQAASVSPTIPQCLESDLGRLVDRGVFGGCRVARGRACCSAALPAIRLVGVCVCTSEYHLSVCSF